MILHLCIRSVLTLASSIAVLLAGHSAQAANGTWLNTGAVDGNWATISNWVSATVPATPSAT